MEWLPAAQQAARASAHRPTALATGRAGDVFLCHPFLVHAASWPHRGHLPRMIAQPAVALHGQYALAGRAGGDAAPGAAGDPGQPGRRGPVTAGQREDSTRRATSRAHPQDRVTPPPPWP